MFKNTFVDYNMEDDDLSQMLHDVEGRFLSARWLKKLKIMRKATNTPLYPGCTMNKLEADIMLFVF